MADEPAPPPVPAQGNETEARTATGEIKDQQATQPVTTPESKSATESKSSTETKPEAKPEDAKKPEDTKGPPEKYDLKAPEGFEIDPKLVEEATPIFKELGLNQDQAQKLTDLWNRHSVAAAEEAGKAYDALRDTWRKDVVGSDLGDGKEGLRPEVQKNINTAITAIGDPKAIDAFKEAMNTTGVGDNPAFVRAMNAFGKLLSEGTLVRGGGPSPAGQKAPGAAQPSAARALFPNLPSSANP